MPVVLLEQLIDEQAEPGAFGEDPLREAVAGPGFHGALAQGLGEYLDG